MQVPEEPDKNGWLLTEKIEELESLLRNKEESTQPTQPVIPVLETLVDKTPVAESEIPVLDELVTSNDYKSEQKGLDSTNGTPVYTSEQIMKIIDSIEHKLTDEVESLVDAVKESILQEIISRLDGHNNQNKEKLYGHTNAANYPDD